MHLIANHVVPAGVQGPEYLVTNVGAVAWGKVGDGENAPWVRRSGRVVEFQTHFPAATPGYGNRIRNSRTIWNGVIVPVAMERLVVRAGVRHGTSVPRCSVKSAVAREASVLARSANSTGGLRDRAGLDWAYQPSRDAAERLPGRYVRENPGRDLRPRDHIHRADLVETALLFSFGCLPVRSGQGPVF